MPEYTVGALTIRERVGPVSNHIGLTNIDFPTNIDVSGNDSGSLYEEFQSVTNYAPVANGTSKAIKELIDLVGLNGQCIGAALTLDQLDVISRKMETCQTALGATPHIRDRVTTGLIRLGTLTADRNQDATLSFMVDCLTDGTNAPVARTDGVAMPSPLTVERFTVGQLKIGGVVQPDVEGWSLDFGVNISEKTPALGFVWPDAVGITTVRPVLTLRGRDLSKVTTALLAFSANGATHANTLLQLIKRQSGGAFVSFATAEHIAITCAGLIVPENLVSAAANQRATNTLRIPLHYDGTNAPVLFNTAIAYDTTP